MPLYGYADGRNYLLMPVAPGDPRPLALNGKAYTKIVGGKAQLFFESDDGTVYQVTPGGGSTYPFELPETVTPAPVVDTGKLYSKDVGGVTQLFYLDDTATETQLTPPVGLYYAYVVWRPAFPSGAGHVQTWAEVETLITATQGKITVAVDGNGVIPNTASTNCFGRVIFQSFTNNTAGVSILVQDGGQLINPYKFEGNIVLAGAPTAISFVALNGGFICSLTQGATLRLEAGATVSAVEMTGSFTNFSIAQGGQVQDNSGTPGISIITLLPGTVAINTLIELISTTPGPAKYPANLFAGDATTVLVQLFDANSPSVAQVNFLGTLLSFPIAFAAGLSYDDALVTPTIGATFVQGVLDVLKRRTVGFGNTASRPAIPADVNTGGMYFDTDLGYAVWSDGAIWVNASGVPA